MSALVLRALIYASLMWAFYAGLRSIWRATPSRRRNGALLRPGKFPIALGIALGVLGPTSSWLMFSVFPEFRGSTTATLAWTGVAVACAAMGVGVVTKASRSVVVVTRSGVLQKPACARIRHIAWRAVARVEYHRGRGAVVLAGERSSVMVGLMMRGFGSFLQDLQSFVDPALVKPMLTRLQKDYPPG